MSQWSELKALYIRHRKEHEAKMGPLRITKALDPMMAKWKGAASPNVQAVYWTIQNNSNDSIHFVGLAVDPDTSFITMWCSDKPYADSQKVKESPCNFWKQRTINNGQYVCKHCWHVINEEGLATDKAKQRQVESKLGLATSPTALANGHGKLQNIIKYRRNAHVFGPTGSGKTHDIMEMLNDNAAAFTVKQVFITSGLHDTDLLMKLIPSPETEHKDAPADTQPEIQPNESMKGMFSALVRFLHKIIALLSKFLPNIGRSGWTRLDGELLAAFKEAHSGDKPVVVLLEELTRSNESVRRALVKVMDNQSGSYTLHDFTTGKFITVPEDKLLFIATSNFGYEDTSPIDPALARRFPITIFYDYNEQKEKEIIGKLITASQVKQLQGVAQKIRTQYRSGRLPRPLDTGSLIEWATIISKDPAITVKEAAELTWVYRIVDTDSMGYPEMGQVEAILDLFSKS